MKNSAYIGRQPILDREKKIFGYELLYRGNGLSSANVIDNKKASSDILISLVNNTNIYNITGNKKVFVNMDESLITFNFECVLSPEKFVLEVLENTKVNEEIVEKIKKLKNFGFKIALDDFRIHNQTKVLLELADFIKVDVLNTPKDEILKIVNLGKKYNCRLLAEKVENNDMYKWTKDIGFELFQGYFFAKPEIVLRKKITPHYTVLIKLLNYLNNENVDINIVEEFFSEDVKLSYNLLRFVNSAYFSLKTPIKSVKHAIAFVGFKKLRIWILLMLYSHEFDKKFEEDPAIELAIIRGKIMELLTKNKGEEISDKAHLVGLLSLIDIITGINKKQFLEEVELDKDIKDALIQPQKNFLGKILYAIELFEAEDYSKADKILKEFNLSIEDLFKAEQMAVEFYEEFKNQILSYT